MLKFKKFKTQIAFEYFIGFSILLFLFFVFFYLYLNNYKHLNELLEYINLENECYFISSKFNSIFPIVLKNISYYESFDINLKYEAEIKDYKVVIGNVSCYTKIENVIGKIKNGKNLIIVENGEIRIYQI